jgi:mono/diheme cytochrome c family protein
MKGKAIIYLSVWGVLFFLLPACQGGGGYAPTPTPPAATPEQTTAPTQGYAMGPGMQNNFGMMQHNVGQMYGMMGQGYMRPQHYNQMMGMMGQMGGMMQQMGGPSYNQEMEQRQRQQLQEMKQNLSTIEREKTTPAAASRLGADLFARNCAGCHPYGGNTIVVDLPLKGAPQLKDFNTFRAYVRYPTLPNGSRGAMPGFSPARISDRQMRELYRYLVSLWGE